MGTSNRSQSPTAAGTAPSYRCRGTYAKIPIPGGGLSTGPAHANHPECKPSFGVPFGKV